MTSVHATGNLPEAPDVGVLDEVILEALDEVDAPTRPPEGQPWKVTDEGQADWAARKLAKAKAELHKAEDLAARQRQAILHAIAPHMDAIELWLAGERKRIDAEVERWEALLVEFHRSRLAEDPKAPKTIRLPHGTLSARKNPDRWEFSDEFVEWARQYHPSLLREEVTKPAAKRAILVDPDGTARLPYADEESGELLSAEVPGVSVVTGEVRFAVEVEEVGR